MHEYKVGDKVKVLHTDYPSEIKKGDITRVVGVDAHGVDLEGKTKSKHHSGGWYFKFNEVQPYKDTDFKVGDTVRALKGDHIDNYIGKAGKLKKIDRGDELPYLVDFGENCLWCSEIEPYEDNELKVGQTVRSLDRGYVGELIKQDKSGAPYYLMPLGDGRWCREVEPFNTYGLDITHADDKTVTVRLTHEQLAHLACHDYGSLDKIYWQYAAERLNLKPFTGKQTPLRDFVRESTLLDHLRPQPKPEKWVPKSGDPVRCVKGFSSLYESHDNIILGKVYIVDKLLEDRYLVATSMKSKNSGFVYTEHFEPATDFRPGDVVELLEDDSPYKAGDVVELESEYAPGWFTTPNNSTGIRKDRLRHTDKPITQPFKPGWYVQIGNEHICNVMYLKVKDASYKTRINSNLNPIRLRSSYKHNGDYIYISTERFTETELRAHALDIIRDGSKKISCTTITRDELPELIKFFEEFIPMARKAVEDEKKRLGKDVS